MGKVNSRQELLLSVHLHVVPVGLLHEEETGALNNMVTVWGSGAKWYKMTWLRWQQCTNLTKKKPHTGYYSFRLLLFCLTIINKRLHSTVTTAQPDSTWWAVGVCFAVGCLFFFLKKKKGKNPPGGLSAAASKLLCACSAICLLLSCVKAFHSFYFCQSRDSGASFRWTQVPQKKK